MEGSSDFCWQMSDNSSSRRLWDSSNVFGRTNRRKGDRDDGVDHRVIERDDISLRQWLDNPERTVDNLECLHIFNQIVEIVNIAHCQGIVLHNVRPSCFVMSSYNHVSFIESASCSDSGSDSSEDGSNRQTEEFKDSSSLPSRLTPEPSRERSYLVTEMNPANVSRIVSETSQFHASEAGSNEQFDEDDKPPFPMKQILVMETTWYTSPEEVAGAPGTCASDIYRLGVLLFELFCTFSSAEEKSTTMSSLRHRVLPPQLLLRCPKEASFCLWLLHPDPNSRPKMGELMQSDFLNEPKNNLSERDAAIELRERIEEQELLLEFLMLIQQRKQGASDSLHETLSFLSSDMEEVTKLQKSLGGNGGGDSISGPTSTNFNDDEDQNDSDSSESRKRSRQGIYAHNGKEYDELSDENQSNLLSKNSRLMKNFRKLEAAYFLMRRRAFEPARKPLTRHSHPISSDSKGSTAVTERSSLSNVSSREKYDEDGRSGWVHSFLEGLCKYLSFSTLKVKANLKQGDLLNSSNLVCSLGFDRDGEFFATAGVNKKIKVFEYNSILDEDRDVHYPACEMASRSKLSSICWNGYIKSQIASSNFEGLVQVWDVTRSQIFMEMKEHERRIWSVDFSVAEPTMLASGSDDGSVKLWNINQGASVGTIKTKANVCCVQFPLNSGRSLAFGSADHKIYYYDLRNAKMPLCTLIGHNKTVSYVKFIDSTTLVSASTDNSLKLWDLSMSTSRVLDCPLQSFSGHMNVKNFVGLSVSDGYIATGSETNELNELLPWTCGATYAVHLLDGESFFREDINFHLADRLRSYGYAVFIYHKAFPMPALSYKFNSTDTLSGDEVDDGAQFISSVCWRGQSSSTLLAANSLGNIKILEMV